MPLNTLNQFTQTVSDLPDKPNTQMSAAELKASFDAAAQELRQHTNANTNVLKSTTAGDSGAENLGSANISGVTGTTAHAQIKDVFNQLQNVVLGQIPNKSITRDKFADGAVDFSPVQLEIANLNLQLAASQLVPSGKTYGWDPKTSFGVIVDFTKGKTTAQLNAGDTDLEGKVTMSQGTFVAGKKVTVIGRNPADNSIVKEQATITSVSPLTISPLVNSYKAGAWIKRTTANNTTNGIKFGGVDDSVIKNITDATVVNQAYQTSASARPQVLANGWLVKSAYNNTTKILYLYVSKDNGATFTQLCSIGGGANGNFGFSITRKDNRVFVLTNSGGQVAYFYNIDATTVTNVDISTGTPTGAIKTTLDSQTDFSGVSITINEPGTELHAAWASKNSTYPNSFNIRYAKGTINADGSVTWGAVEQWTISNSSLQFTNPTIAMRSNGKPIVICDTSLYTGTGLIVALGDGLANIATGSYAVPYSHIYNGGSYAQSSPSAIFVPQSVNGLANGRIWVAWHGYDATDTSKWNIRVSYSDDGGVTFSAMQKLTSGNLYHQNGVSVTANKANEVFFLFSGETASGTRQIIRKVKYNGSFSGVTDVTAYPTSGHHLSPSTLFDLSVNFTEPLFIYQNTNTPKVGFYGTWTIGTETPITENTLRFRLTQQAKEVMTYLKHTAGLTATAKANGQAMDKTTTSQESQFTKVLASLQDIEIEITLSRATVNDDITIDKILGGVA